MALAVASTSTVSGSNSGSLVVTKPTGVAVGDLLLIAVGGGGAGGAGEQITFTCSGFSESYRKQHDPGGSTTICSVAFLYKIADASDVSASNYTVSTPTRYVGAVVMFRITGWPVTNPIYHSAGGGAYQDGNLTVNDAVSFSRFNEQLLIMIGFSADTGSDPGGAVTFSNYQITSSDSNPTWTELYEVGMDIDVGTVQADFFCAYAISSNTSTVTSYGFTKTGDSAGAEETTVWAIGIIYTPINVTADISHQAITPTIEGVTASQVTVTADVSQLAVIPNLNGIETDNSSDHTQWTNETKPTATTWTNQDK